MRKVIFGSNKLNYNKTLVSVIEEVPNVVLHENNLQAGMVTLVSFAHLQTRIHQMIRIIINLLLTLDIDVVIGEAVPN